MSHLKKVGGVFEEKENRKMKQVPMLCKFHYGANIFLRELYKDYNGGEIGCITLWHDSHQNSFFLFLSFHLDGVGHKALYHLNDDNYQKGAVILRKRREKQAIVKEKMPLQKELSTTKQKMLELEKINIAL